jgi:hypothetical protein
MRALAAKFLNVDLHFFLLKYYTKGLKKNKSITSPPPDNSHKI